MCLSWLRLAYIVLKPNPVCLFKIRVMRALTDGTVWLITGPSGRSFAVKVVYETQTYEPIDYFDPPDDEKLNGSFIDKNTRTGTVSRA